VLLGSAGLADGVCDIVLEGDRGVPTEEPKPPGRIAYAHSIPRARAMEPDVLIAYQMNGSYAGPRILRAIVLGFYGMSSVKWSTDTVVATQPFQGYWQTSDYGIGMITKGYPYATRSRK
jgi:DMSO/TMAO reductase YedYZ molybdopterin-dependent catalytic subunit